VTSDGPPVENRYAAARRAVQSRTDFVDLIDTNFQRCGFVYPGDILLAGADRFFGAARRYDPHPAGSETLREAIAGFHRGAWTHGHGTTRPAMLTTDSVVVTASASESYSLVFASICRPGDHVLLPRPGYPLFEDLAARAGLEVDYYALRPESGWRYDPEEIAGMISSRTRAIVLISPGNPTGLVIDEELIHETGRLCIRHGLFLLVDEVFSEFVFGTGAVPRPMELLDEVLVFTINGISKLFASPDLKISWVAATGPAPATARAVEELHIRNDIFLSASALSQDLATTLFAEGPEFTRSMVTEVGCRRRFMLEEIRRTEGLGAVPPSGGIHIPVFVDPSALGPGADDESLVVDLLLECGVAAHPGYLYGIDGQTALVMSYLADEPRIREGFSRIRDYLRDRRS
jgi:aspartate/methionine/tyrosine aminotransferase